MAKISVCMVGIDGWEEWTLPAVLSIRDHEPEVNILVIDNGSDKPYPEFPRMRMKMTNFLPGVSKTTNTPEVRIIRTPRTCYTAAINTAVRASGDSGWWLVLNNDVTCTAPFVDQIKELPDNAIYGRQIITERGHTWLGLWLALFPRRLWEAVGPWDEEFKMCGFDDADYCLRAKALDYETRHLPLPFTHHWGKTRWGLPGYSEARQENRLYFESKHGWIPGSEMVVTHE